MRTLWVPEEDQLYITLRQTAERSRRRGVDGAGELNEAVSVEADGDATPIQTALDAAGRTTGFPLRPGQIASDSWQYAAAGIATVGLGTGMPGYHTEGDTAERAKPETLVAMTRLVVATVEHPATQTTNTTTTRTAGAGDMNEPLTARVAKCDAPAACQTPRTKCLGRRRSAPAPP